MKQALFVYNPISGSRLVPKELDRIAEVFQKNGIYLDLFRLQDGCEQALRKALHREDIDFVVGAGGDGTIGYIARLLHEEEVSLPYGTLGTGTCNNFTHNIDMPQEIEPAIEIICKGERIFVDMGLVNEEEIFLSSLACGVFAGISFETNPDSKMLLGPMAYYLQAITELTNIRSYPVRIDTGTEVIEEKVYLILVLNGTSVGSFKQVFAEDAVDISDGLMEMVLIRECSPMDLANLVMSFMNDQNYENLQNVRVIRSEYFRIESEEEMSVSLDGEKGVPLPLEVRVLKKRLEVFRP